MPYRAKSHDVGVVLVLVPNYAKKEEGNSERRHRGLSDSLLFVVKCILDIFTAEKERERKHAGGAISCFLEASSFKEGSYSVFFESSHFSITRRTGNWRLS